MNVLLRADIKSRAEYYSKAINVVVKIDKKRASMKI
jgi:uncharacterized protein YqkB